MKNTIVIMSGSFNPPTIAHHKTMLAAVETLDAKKGFYVPTPDKGLRYKMRKAGFPEELPVRQYTDGSHRQCRDIQSDPDSY